jgi:hypothetical protein
MNKNDAQQQRPMDFNTQSMPFEGASGTWPKRSEPMSQKQELPDHVWDLLLSSHSAITDAHELIDSHCDEPIEAVAIGDTVLSHLATAQAAIERIALTYSSALSESNDAAESEPAMTENRGTRQEIDELVSSLRESAEQLDIQLDIQIDHRAYAMEVNSIKEFLGPSLRRAVELTAHAPTELRRVELSVTFAEALCGRGMVEFLVADTGPRSAEMGSNWGVQWHSAQTELVRAIGGVFEVIPIPADGGSVVHMQIPMRQPNQQLAA